MKYSRFGEKICEPQSFTGVVTPFCTPRRLAWVVGAAMRPLHSSVKHWEWSRVSAVQIPTLVVAICVGNVYYTGESKLVMVIAILSITFAILRWWLFHVFLRSNHIISVGERSSRKEGRKEGRKVRKDSEGRKEGKEGRKVRKEWKEGKERYDAYMLVRSYVPPPLAM